jgi:hypothetical protein
MFMFDWSARMAPRRPPWTASVYFHDSYPKYRHLEPKFRHSLSSFVLDKYIGDSNSGCRFFIVLFRNIVKEEGRNP